MLTKLIRVIALIANYPMFLLSFFTPRKKNRWIFGSNNGFGCNAKYLFIETVEKEPSIEAIWITRSKGTLEKMRAMGIENSYYYLSLKGIYFLFTASKYITTHDLHRSLCLWTIGNAKWINLWHGVGIKSLRFKAETSPLKKIAQNPLLKILSYPILIHLYYRPDIFLVTSPLMAKHFTKCFNLKPNQLYFDEYPRCKPLTWNYEKSLQFIKKHEPITTQQLITTISRFNKTYLYMPTWRKSGSKFGIDLNFDFEYLNNFLREKNAVFLIKLHPYASVNLDAEKTQYSNIFFLKQDLDLYSLLKFSDALITDYSSIYYDYILMPDKEVLLYPFDYEDYITHSRDLAFDYDDHTPGQRAYSFNELMSVLESNTLTSTNDVKIQEMKDIFWAHQSEKQNLIEKIKGL